MHLNISTNFYESINYQIYFLTIWYKGSLYVGSVIFLHTDNIINYANLCRLATRYIAFSVDTLNSIDCHAINTTFVKSTISIVKSVANQQV